MILKNVFFNHIPSTILYTYTACFYGSLENNKSRKNLRKTHVKKSNIYGNSTGAVINNLEKLKSSMEDINSDKTA